MAGDLRWQLLPSPCERSEWRGGELTMHDAALSSFNVIASEAKQFIFLSVEPFSFC